MIINAVMFRLTYIKLGLCMLCCVVEIMKWILSYTELALFCWVIMFVRIGKIGGEWEDIL